MSNQKVKDEIMQIIRHYYVKKKWEYYPVINLVQHFGYFPREELNELVKEGKIIAHDSINGKIAEYVKKNDF